MARKAKLQIPAQPASITELAQQIKDAAQALGMSEQEMLEMMSSMQNFVKEK